MTRDQRTVPLLGRAVMQDQRALSENLKRLSDHLDERSNGTGGDDSLAANVGGVALSGTVNTSVLLNPNDDTRFVHRLGRKPTRITSFIGEQPADLLYGFVNGGQGTNGGNQQPWTETEVYVRSSRLGVHNFVVT